MNLMTYSQHMMTKQVNMAIYSQILQRKFLYSRYSGSVWTKNGVKESSKISKKDNRSTYFVNLQNSPSQNLNE